MAHNHTLVSNYLLSHIPQVFAFHELCVGSSTHQMFFFTSFSSTVFFFAWWWETGEKIFGVLDVAWLKT